MSQGKHESPESADAVAILVSGGLDSAILVGEYARRYTRVYPLYIRFGLRWESVELLYLQRFLQAIQSQPLQSLVILEQPVVDLYGLHWSVTGQSVPDAESPDEAVFLPGRNVFLLAKAMIWCHLRGVATIAMAPLESNPFPDATSSFFSRIEAVMNQAVEGKVRVVRPYAHLHKTDVLRRGQDLPLQWTFSCIQPINELHCGVCNKCAERQKGFHEAGLPDPTLYHRRESCSP